MLLLLLRGEGRGRTKVEVVRGRVRAPSSGVRTSPGFLVGCLILSSHSFVSPAPPGSSPCMLRLAGIANEKQKGKSELRNKKNFIPGYCT